MNRIVNWQQCCYDIAGWAGWPAGAAVNGLPCDWYIKMALIYGRPDQTATDCGERNDCRVCECARASASARALPALAVVCVRCHAETICLIKRFCTIWWMLDRTIAITRIASFYFILRMIRFNWKWEEIKWKLVSFGCDHIFVVEHPIQINII